MNRPQPDAPLLLGQRRRTLRLVLGLNAALDATMGASATLAPHSFYRHVLGVDLLGPYNQHLLSDVGGFYLGFGLLFAWAARNLARELVRAACASAVLTSILHFTYHAQHLEHFTGGQGATQTAGLAIAIALPIIALLISRSG